MGGKVLFTASTYSHVVNFHLAYLERFCRERVLPIVWEQYAALASQAAAV